MSFMTSQDTKKTSSSKKRAKEMISNEEFSKGDNHYIDYIEYNENDEDVVKDKNHDSI